jgi:hypothetical protein
MLLICDPKLESSLLEASPTCEARFKTIRFDSQKQTFNNLFCSIPKALTLPFPSVTGSTRTQKSFCNQDCRRNRSPSSNPCRSRVLLARGASTLIFNSVGYESLSRLFPLDIFILLVLWCVMAAGASTEMPEMHSQRNILLPSQRPKLGLNVAGRLKCYLWGQLPTRGPRSSRSLMPLFPASRYNLEEAESKPESSQRSVHPSSVYTTADYHFQKERCYGLKNIGLLFQWKLQSGDRGNVNAHRLAHLPSKLDVAFDHAIPPIALSNPTDSASLCLSWDHGTDDSTIDLAPWIKLGVHHTHQEPGGSLGFFCPLSKRLTMQWTSHWDVRNPTSHSFMVQPVDRSRSSDPDWWIPDVKLDPFGFLSSENRFSSNWRENCFMDVKLKIFTMAPSLIFGRMVDEEYPTAMLRLECSICDERDDRPSATTARFETLMISSCWWQSIRESSRVTILREQHNVIIRKS